MDDSQKEQIISAIYLAIRHKNYRCARTIFDVTLKEAINETLDQAIILVENHNAENNLKDRIQELKFKI